MSNTTAHTDRGILLDENHFLKGRIEELELRYKIASGLVLTWGNYNSRQHLEDEIDKIAATLNREKAE